MAEPAYRRIADDLRAKIESGDLVPGSQLPTETELMKQYRASRNTVRDAIKLLTTRGLAETRPGQGAFVVERINPFVTTLTGSPADPRGGETSVYVAAIAASGSIPASSTPKVDIQQASRELASALRIKPGSQVVSRQQQRFINGIPWSLQTSFYPIWLVEQGATQLSLAESIEEGAVTYLARELGIQQAGYQDSITVRAPDETEAAFFKLPSNGRTPVFEIYRIGFGGNGQPFRLTVTIYPTDRNRFLVELIDNICDVPRRSAMTTDAHRRT